MRRHPSRNFRIIGVLFWAFPWLLWQASGHIIKTSGLETAVFEAAEEKPFLSGWMAGRVMLHVLCALANTYTFW
jgi:hypothetical protein